MFDPSVMRLFPQCLTLIMAAKLGRDTALVLLKVQGQGRMSEKEAGTTFTFPFRNPTSFSLFLCS